jgi:hypothetical protein
MSFCPFENGRLGYVGHLQVCVVKYSGTHLFEDVHELYKETMAVRRRPQGRKS